MTTYTITQEQIDLLTGVLERAGTTDDGEYKWDTHSKATKLLQSLTPNSGEPVGEVSGNAWDEGLLYRDCEPGAPLYLHPAAPSTSLTKDQFDSLVDDLAEWSRHVEVDTAPTTLTKHIEKVFAIYNIKGGE